MSNQQYSVEVQEDYLKNMTGAKPVQALTELIWNALNADAIDVGVSSEYNELETLAEVLVCDNGRGIARSHGQACACSRNIMLRCRGRACEIYS